MTEIANSLLQQSPPIAGHILRPAQASDTVALAKLGRDCFCETFEHLYRREDLEYFLKHNYDEKTIAEDISDPLRRIILAERLSNQRLSGFVKLGLKVGLDFPYERDMMELKQLYILEEAQGLGLGKILMQEAIQLSQKLGASGLMLSVWQGNFKAQKFYQGFGFANWGETYFMVGTQSDNEFVYGLKFKAIAK